MGTAGTAISRAHHTDSQVIAPRLKAAWIPGLDGLRGLSIALVFAGHLGGGRGFLPADVMRHFGDLANLGVRVFFVISGFLITGLLIRETEAKGRISLGEFYYRRAFRILPAFYTFLAAAAIAQALGVISLKSGDLVHAATFTTNYHHDRAWWLGHIWSLSVEEQFYLLWPAAILWFGERRALHGAVAVIFIAPVIRLLALALWPDAPDAVGEAFPTIADTIATGCLFAALAPRLRRTPTAHRVLTSRWFFLVPALAFALNLKAGGRLSAGVCETVINLCIGLCVVRASTVTTGAAARLLNAAPLAFVGRLSYSLYLWQQPFLNRHASAAAMTFPLNVALAISCATMSFYLVERPCLALRDRHRKHRTETDSAAVRQPVTVC